MAGRRDSGFGGNALMEYALPMTIILLIAGVLAVVMDINGFMGKYFMASSGNTSSSLDGTTFKPKPLGGSGALGNGQAGFDGFGQQLDGNGNPIPWSISGTIYNGPVNRPQTAGGSGTEFIYPVQINWGSNGGPGSIPEDASNELQARIMAAAETTRQLGNAQQNGDQAAINYATAQLAAQQAGAAAYASRNYEEVLQMNVSDFQQAMNLISQSVQSGGEVENYYEPWLIQEWLDERGQWNTGESSPGQAACSQDFSSCQNTATGTSMSIEQFLLMMGFTEEQIYGAMINNINNNAATPISDDSFYSWWVGTDGGEDVAEQQRTAMTQQYFGQ